jgi:hypothetical protein
MKFQQWAYYDYWLFLLWVAIAFNICSGINTYLNMRRLRKRAHDIDEMFRKMVMSMKSEKKDFDTILEQLKFGPQSKD